MQQADIGVVGLAVMGQNLVLNMEEKGFTVAVYNRTTARVDEFIAKEARGKKVLGAHSFKELVSLLRRPRKILIMVKAGPAVDETIDQLIPYLEKGDLIIDGGNSNFLDTNRRSKALKEKGFLFIGAGISGGEEGARFGPSLMPGGNSEAWPLVKELFNAIAAKVDGKSCTDWVGEEGSGHFVKMVHNGIEYGDLQLISEAYMLMKELLGMSEDEMAKTFAEWNKRELSSYLIEITSHVLRMKEPSGAPLVEKILDVAGQKGTGKWTVMSALDLSVPVTLISEAVFARSLSQLKEERVMMAKLYGKKPDAADFDRAKFLEDLFYALYAAKIVSYAQGYMLMREASKSYGWKLNFGAVALMWRGGCIIRSQFLDKINQAFTKNPSLSNLLFDEYFAKEMKRAEAAWRRVVSKALLEGVAVPALTSALSFFDGLSTAYLPANLVQALRDYFGAHMYERVDEPRGQFFHTNWTGSGGDVTSTSYSI